MKGSRWIAVLALAGLISAAVASTGMSHVSAHERAAAAYRLRGLISPNGQFNAHLYQSALRARARMLAQGAAQNRARLPGGATIRATAPSVINWTEIGPGNVGGRINAIWIDSKNAQHLIVGAAGGGLWQSSDGGASWTAVAEFPGTLAVGAIAQMPSGTLVAGTGDTFNEVQPGAGFLESTDNGVTWQPIASSGTVDFSVVHSISASTSDILLATSDNGVFRSPDGGQTWVQVLDSMRTGGGAFDVLFDPNNASNAISSSATGAVFFSTDSGQTWTTAKGLLPTEFQSGYRISLAYDRSIPGSVFALVNNNPLGPESGELFHSSDDGATWSLRAGTGSFVNTYTGTATGALCDNFTGTAICQGDYDNAIIVLPHAMSVPPTIVVGGIDVFKSADGGNSWTQIGFWVPSSPNYIHADQHALAFDSANGNLYVGNDGGMFEMPLASNNWIEINSGLAVTQLYSISGHMNSIAKSNAPGGIPIIPILAGSQDNGSLLYQGYVDGGQPKPDDWTAFFGGDGGTSQVDPINGDYLYSEYTQMQMEYSNKGGPFGQLFGSEPSDSGSAAAFIAPFALVPNGATPSDKIIAGGFHLWLGNNIQSGNPSWAVLNNGSLPVGPNDSGYGQIANNNYITAVAIDPSNPNNIWVGFTEGQIWHTSNAESPSGPTWVNAIPNEIKSYSASSVTSFWIVPGANLVYVTFAGNPVEYGSVYVTTDDGHTWTGVGTQLPPGPVYSLVTNPSYPQILYVGTLTGVYTSINGGQTWYASSQGPANVSVNQLSWFDTSNAQAPVLLAATDGRGAWLGSPAYNPTPTLTALNPALILPGSPATTLTLTGSGFVRDATVSFDDAAIAVTYLSSTQLQVTVPTSSLAIAATHTFVVNNPIPGGGASAGAILTVPNPTPILTSISPTSAKGGVSVVQINVTGSNFLPTSTVDWNGTPLLTTYLSATQMTGIVPSGDLASAIDAAVTVINPAPGGGSSSAITFSVSAPPAPPTPPAPPSGGGGALSAADLLALVGFYLLSLRLRGSRRDA